MNVAIIGGGAAGFFLAIELKRMEPHWRVVILERSARVLTKVGLSGGGRCNVTNTFEQVTDLSKIYPRGHRLMKRLLREFSQADAFSWFEAHGAALTVQADGCVFPRSGEAGTIVTCLQRAATACGVEVHCDCRVASVTRQDDGQLALKLVSSSSLLYFDKVALTSGGAPHAEGHDWLQALGHRLETPCPSLFTLSIPHRPLTLLAGITVPNVVLTLAGTKFRSSGSLLITHWGLSGPATLKLSSYAARQLSEQNFRAPLLVNWLAEPQTDKAVTLLLQLAAASPRRQLGSVHPPGLQQRLWLYLLERCALSAEKPWAELGSKSINRLATVLTADAYRVEGRGAFREEFVTCGGVSLDSVSARTLQSKVCPNLYFAGEVLDIDAVTGGFNFQAAWTTAYVAAHGMMS